MRPGTELSKFLRISYLPLDILKKLNTCTDTRVYRTKLLRLYCNQITQCASRAKGLKIC